MRGGSHIVEKGEHRVWIIYGIWFGAIYGWGKGGPDLDNKNMNIAVGARGP